MPKKNVRARILLPKGIEPTTLEALVKDVEGVGLSIMQQSPRTLTVQATKEQWEKIGIPLEERKYGAEVYYNPGADISGPKLPDPLQKYENLRIYFPQPVAFTRHD